MELKYKIIIVSFFLLLGFTNPFSTKSQEIIEIAPLFEYPVAPEELISLTEKSDYLVEHFWDSFDFATKEPIDQNALNHAFSVYISPVRWASMDKANKSIDRLIANISKSPLLSLQFMKAAEENLYGPRAEVWIDEVYLKFIDNLVKNKKISEDRKKKYQLQAASIRNTRSGEKAPTFKFIDAQGNENTYFPMTTPTMIIFGNPTDTDWRLARLRMETDVKISSALDKGQLNIIYIIPYNLEEWEKETDNYSSKWIVGTSPSVSEIVDIRALPTILTVGSDGLIIQKHLLLSEAIETIKETLNN